VVGHASGGEPAAVATRPIPASGLQYLPDSRLGKTRVRSLPVGEFRVLRRGPVQGQLVGYLRVPRREPVQGQVVGYLGVVEKGPIHDRVVGCLCFRR
jgi:hypothetical protein